MQLTPRPSPNTRAHLERRVNLLREVLANDRLRIPSIGALNSIAALRVTPNVRLNVATVDERVRSLLLLVENTSLGAPPSPSLP